MHFHFTLRKEQIVSNRMTGYIFTPVGYNNTNRNFKSSSVKATFWLSTYCSEFLSHKHVTCLKKH